MCSWKNKKFGVTGFQVIGMEAVGDEARNVGKSQIMKDFGTLAKELGHFSEW